MRFLIICILVLSVELISGQDFYVRGKVTDSNSGMPIVNTQISVKEVSTLLAISDANGNFSLSIPRSQKKITLTFDAINYSIKEVALNNNGTDIELTVELDFMSILLPDINIQSGPETVYRNDYLNVADFVVRPDGMLLLTYEKEERWKRQEDSKTTLYNGCRLILLDLNGKEISRKLISELCVGFKTNFFGDVFLLTHKKIHLINIEDDLIFYTEIERKIYDQQIEPIIDSVDQNIYLSNYNPNYPAFEYMIFNTADSLQRSMRYIVDEEMMRMFRSEYKYMQPREKLEAFRFELETGIDREIIAAYMRGFQNTYYYEPLNAPLFVVHDTILVLDHHHDKLIRYSSSGTSIDSTEINYHKNNKLLRWSERLLKDPTTEKIYTYYEKDGFFYIKEINPSSGKTGEAYKLTHRYSDNIRVSNGYAYYVYRPYESSQNKFLYRERLQR